MKWHSIFFSLAVFHACFFSSLESFSQLHGDDSGFYQSVVSESLSLYHHSSGDQSALYNGMLYPGYAFVFKSGSPFFDSSRSETGSVFYYDTWYQNLQLIYDNLEDVVIINDTGYFIQLNNKNLDEFTLGTHHFMRLEVNDKSNNAYAGFYEILYNGNIRVLKKTIKKIVDDLSGESVVEKSINQSDYYYIKTESSLYFVKNKKDIMGIFADRKKEIQDFIKKNNLNFRENKGNAFMEIAAYYEQIRK
jgi:hypothetical protein